MNIVLIPRGKGKTNNAIRKWLSYGDGALLVVRNQVAKRQAMNCRVPAGCIFTHADVLSMSKLMGRMFQHVIIDDADLLLQSLFPGASIEMVTANLDLRGVDT